MTEYVVDRENVWPYGSHREEIVRCRDCVKAECPEVRLLNGTKRHILTCVRFPSFQHETQPDGFCAWGERRGDAE